MTIGISSLRFLVTCLIGGAAIAAPLIVSPLSASPRTEDARRLAAEIVVMNADAGQLFSGEPSKMHTEGLRARLKGGLALIPLLVRAARRDAGNWPKLDRERFNSIKAALSDEDGKRVIKGLDWLMSSYPFDTTGLLPADTSPDAIRRAKSIHETYCSGCHDHPDLEVSRPAWNLFEAGKTAPLIEVAARLVIGVRGENMTAMDNPLRDSEMSALIGFYRTQKAEEE